MAPSTLEERVTAFRHFSRFYTARIGILSDRAYGSEWSLSEARVLYEISLRDRPTQTDVARALGMDAGYLSRIIRRFEDGGLVSRTTAGHDGRISYLALTARGRRALVPIDKRSHDEVAALLAPLPEPAQDQVVSAMSAIERTLSNEPREVRLRTHGPGDLGWIVERHGTFYAREYGWGGKLEPLVAQVVADFGNHHDPARERCWIAESGGERLGCVMLVRESDRLARLRMLYVEPQARGLGLGDRLVAECTRFAREAGYDKITLWTHSVLTVARAIYAKHGYTLVDAHEHDDFGVPITSETWEVELGS